MLVIAILTLAFLMLKEKGKHSYEAEQREKQIDPLVRLKDDGKVDINYTVNKLFETYKDKVLTATSTENSEQAAANTLINANKKIITDISSAAIKPSLVITADRLTIKPDNQIDLKNYGLALSAALKPVGDMSLEYMPAIPLIALQTQNPLDAKPLTLMKVLLLQRIDTLIKTPAPQSAKDLHLSLINSLLFLSELIYNMEKVLTEPILALESADRYTIEYIKLLKITESFNKYFTAKGVVFSPEDQVKFKANLSAPNSL